MRIAIAATKTWRNTTKYQLNNRNKMDKQLCNTIYTVNPFGMILHTFYLKITPITTNKAELVGTENLMHVAFCHSFYTNTL